MLFRSEAQHPFGNYQKHEDALIYLRTRYVQDEGVKSILDVVGNIANEEVQSVSDDGFAQQVTQKAGIQRLEKTTVPNPVKLVPFRTFREVDQPQSEFLIRMKGAEAGTPPMLAVFETDGGAWRQAAVESIKTYLVKELGEGSPFVVIG